MLASAQVYAEQQAMVPVLSILLDESQTVAAKPGIHNTGATSDQSELTNSASITVTLDGAVIENLYVLGNINVMANNVVIRNCIIQADSFYGIRANNGNTGLLIQDVEIRGMQSAGIIGSNFSVKRANIHDSGGDAIKPFDGVVIESSWLHRLGSIPTSHSDGVQMVVGADIVIRGNNIDMPYDLPGFTNSQCMIIQTNNGPIDNILIENNWLNGGGFCVQIRDKGNGYGPPTDVRILNNQFGRDFQFGAWVFDGPVTRHGNVWQDTGEPLE